MARKPTKTRRNRIIQFRCSDAEHAEILRRADRAGYPPGTFARACVLGKIGSNINQIARAINSGKIPPVPKIEEAVQALLDMDNLVMRALGLSPDQADNDDGRGQ